MKEEPVALLYEAVAAVPGPGCALQRLRAHTGSTAGPLSGVAMEQGFSLHEAHGIMDGWDDVFGPWTCYESYRMYPGYEEGYRLGRDVAMIAAGRKPSDR